MEDIFEVTYTREGQEHVMYSQGEDETDAWVRAFLDLTDEFGEDFILRDARFYMSGEWFAKKRDDFLGE